MAMCVVYGDALIVGWWGLGGARGITSDDYQVSCQWVFSNGLILSNM